MQVYVLVAIIAKVFLNREQKTKWPQWNTR